MTRPWRVAAIVGALAAVQLIAVLGYRWIERGRARPRAFAVAALAGSPAPSFAIERADWTVVEVGGAGRVRLVHFWATWCPPCRDELPALLARAAATPELELIAVSVDDDWTAIRRFFPEGVPAVVVKPRQVFQAYQLRGDFRKEGLLAVFPAEVLVALYASIGDIRDVLVVASALNNVLVFLAIVVASAALMSRFERQDAAAAALAAQHGDA